MKTIILIFLLFTISLPIPAQDAKPKKSKLVVSYDKFRDITIVSTYPRKPKDTLGILVSGYFNHKGELLREPVAFAGLVFDSYSSDWQFLKEGDRRLFVLADGERFEFSSPTRESTVNRGYGPYSRVTVSERLVFSFDKEQLEKLLNARSLEMRLGTYRNSFSFGNETLSDLREMISRMNPRP